MKQFQDLEFKPHSSCLDGKQARMDFENEFGVSVITGSSFYTTSNAPYEVAIIYKGSLTYSTHITDDVIGYCTKNEVTEIMKQVQELKE